MLSQEEARRMGHNHVATEQILLGLIGEGTGIAAKTLKTWKVNLKDARVEVQKIIGTGPGKIEIEIPFTPGAKRALEYAWDEAKQLGVNYIGTEHLLLGIVRVEQDQAKTVLERMGVPIDAVKATVISKMDQASGLARQTKLEPPQLDKFSDDVFRTFIVAREETRRLGHNTVSAELLMLGLIGEENGPAAETLRSQGVTLDNARWETERVIGRGSGHIPVDSPFSELTNDVLKVASALALQSGHECVTGRHLLLAILEIKCAGTETILRNLNVDFAELRSSIISGLGALSTIVGMSSTSKSAQMESVFANVLQHVQGKLASFVDRASQSKDPSPLIVKFTESAVKVTVLAQEETRRVGHNFVGTEQVLLGLIGQKEGIAARALESQGVTLENARREVEKIIGRGTGFVAAEIAFTPRAKRSIELAWQEAQLLGNQFIGCEHWLLGLLQEGEGVAARVLEILNVDRENLRAKTIELIKGGGTATA